MNNFLDKIKVFSQHLGENVAKLFKNETKRNINLEELLNLIKNYNEVKITKKEYLGLYFNTYVIKINDLYFKVETKGKNKEEILEIKILENAETIFSYKSYEENNKKDFYLPEFICAHLN